MEVVQLGIFRYIFALLTAQWYFKVQFKSFQTFQHVLHSKLPWHRCKPLHTPITCSQVFNLIDLEMEEEIWNGELSLSLPVPQSTRLFRSWSTKTIVKHKTIIKNAIWAIAALFLSHFLTFFFFLRGNFYKGEEAVARGCYKQKVHWRKLGVQSAVAFHWVVTVSHWLSCCLASCC